MTKAPTQDGPTRALADFGAQVQFGDLPGEVISRIKLSTLDSLGCCLFGASLPWTRMVADLAMAEGTRAASTLIGMGKQVSASLAALVNGASGHGFELDDIHTESILHVGSLAIPVAMALAEERPAPVSGKSLITAIASGYEVGTRVGNAATTSLFFRGFHPQGTSGVFAATAAAARMLDLDPLRFHHALGVAGSQAGGLMAAQEGAMVKRLHSGRAAQSGVYAASLARAGFTGISDVLEAPYGGFLSAYSGEPRIDRLTDGLGVTWETLQVGYKPHASVTSIHTALDGLAALMKEHTLTADSIQHVRVGLSPMTHVHCAWPYEPRGVTAAQMNLYYGLAVMAIDGAAFTSQFSESRLADPAILAFISRLSAYVDPEIEAMGTSFRHASRVSVRTRTGNTFEQLFLHRRGSPEAPLRPDEIEHKFRMVTADSVEDGRADEIVDIVSRLDEVDDISQLMALVAGR